MQLAKLSIWPTPLFSRRVYVQGADVYHIWRIGGPFYFIHPAPREPLPRVAANPESLDAPHQS
ncbi:MAG: hypothetical protein SFV24_19235 [Gemmatimonadales bacterium]|nr:hypothetical protein [Gemmatimonadales bacterium]